jgi:hypothetical protein
LDKHLHIVCLDVPYPADYGGVFDLFYKIKSLHEAGISIHLHCFEYGRGKQQELNKYCESVNYYERKNIISSFSFRIPYIVSSRANPELLANLQKDGYPILLEGIHCTFYLFSGDLTGRKVMVRLHNVEYNYYNELSKSTNDILRKAFFKLESLLLKKYETLLVNKAIFFTVSEKDKETYKKLGAKRIEYLPVFLPFTQVNSEAGKGSFCLYHGNLSVPENEKAAFWLLENVVNVLDLPLVIAGKNPSVNFETKARKNDNVCVVANPTSQELDDLIRKAQVNLLPSFNVTGVKIKLLNALFNGRFIITNKESVEGTGLEDLCIIADTIEEFKEKTAQAFNKASFTEADIHKRKNLLEKNYDNESNVQKLIQLIW